MFVNLFFFLRAHCTALNLSFFLPIKKEMLCSWILPADMLISHLWEARRLSSSGKQWQITQRKGKELRPCWKSLHGTEIEFQCQTPSKQAHFRTPLALEEAGNLGHGYKRAKKHVGLKGAAETQVKAVKRIWCDIVLDPSFTPHILGMALSGCRCTPHIQTTNPFIRGTCA